MRRPDRHARRDTSDRARLPHCSSLSRRGPRRGRGARHRGAEPRHFDTAKKCRPLPTRPPEVGDPPEQGLTRSVLRASRDRRGEHRDDSLPTRRLRPVGLQHRLEHGHFAAPQPAQHGVDGDRIAAMSFEESRPPPDRACPGASRRDWRPVGSVRPSPCRPAASAPPSESGDSLRPTTALRCGSPMRERPSTHPPVLSRR